MAKMPKQPEKRPPPGKKPPAPPMKPGKKAPMGY